eukprot:4724455-Lingulodinium_polyedra.AAC.1
MQRRSAPGSLRHFPAEPQLVTLALNRRKGPGCRASPTLSIQRGRCAPPLRPQSREVCWHSRQGGGASCHGKRLPRPALRAPPRGRARRARRAATAGARIGHRPC